MSFRQRNRCPHFHSPRLNGEPQRPDSIRRRTHLSALVVSAVAITTLAAPASAAPAYAAPPSSRSANGLIAYAQHGDIKTIEPDGSDLTVLTADGHNSGPTWSPDGARIAYVHAHDLWIMNADGTGQVALTSKGRVSPGGPSWSPDGTQLAFGGPCIGSDACNDYFDTHFALDTISASIENDGPATQVTDNGAALEVLDRVSWSGTGEEIAFSSAGFENYPGDGFIIVYNIADGTGVVENMVGAGGLYGKLAYPAFSPDSVLLAYDAYIYGQPDIIHSGIVDCGYPTGPCNFKDLLHDSQLAFAPAGDRVVLVRDLHRDRMVLADPDGTHRVRLAYGAQPSWQPVTG